jgi:AAA domain
MVKVISLEMYQRQLWEAANRPQAAAPVLEVTEQPHGSQADTVRKSAAQAQSEPAAKLIKSSTEFVADFVAPSYLLDGILQKHFVYTLTAATGVGKTAIAIRLAAHVALGRKLGDRDVERGRVLYFAAENYVDVQARWIAAAQHMGFDPNAIEVYFVSGATRLSEIADRITAEAQIIGDLALVVVDTSAATFEGADENSNVDALIHAKRIRSLTELRGNPTALLLCHPVKSANNENLQPRGGGALIAEMDGNLCARKGDSSVEMHWFGKFRGMDFAPMHFRLDTVVAERLKDARGRNMPTVLATPIDEAAKQNLAASERSDQDKVLCAIGERRDGVSLSMTDIAKGLGWTMANGQPHKVKVQRAIERLSKDGLITKFRGDYIPTPNGEKMLNKLKYTVTPPVTVLPPMPVRTVTPLVTVVPPFPGGTVNEVDRNMRCYEALRTAQKPL